MLAQALLLLAAVTGTFAQTPIVSTLLCGDAVGNYSNSSIVYSTYDTNSTIFYVWSTVGTPTLLLVDVDAGDLPDTTEWTCPSYANDAFNFSTITIPNVINALSAVVFTHVIEFNDAEQDAIFRETNALGNISLTNIAWSQPVQVGDNIINITSIPIERSTQQGNYTFWVSIQGKLNWEIGRETQLPALPYADKSVTFTFEIYGYPYKGETSKLAVLTYVPSLGTVLSKTAQSIDDEYMPKIFEYTTITSTSSTNVYMAFRPVAFGTYERSDNNFTLAELKNLMSGVDSNISNSLAYFVPHNSADYGYLTFGQNGDQAYNFPFLLLDFVHGSGIPESDSLSTSLILIMITTISLPGVALVISILYIANHRRKLRKTGYQPIN